MDIALAVDRDFFLPSLRPAVNHLHDNIVATQKGCSKF